MGQPNEKILIITFHGFLGSPRDFQYFEDNLNIKSIRKSKINITWWHVSMMEAILEKRKFLKKLNEKFKLFEKILLVGYSMGGRYVLDLLRKLPKLDNISVILISTHPGMANYREQKERVLYDSILSDLIMHAPDFFIISWNNHDVLLSSQSKKYGPALIKNFGNRVKQIKWAKILSNYSTGVMPFFSQTHGFKIKNAVWLFGSEDKKYCALGEKLKKINENVMILAGGHRLIIESKRPVLKIIKEQLLCIGAL